MAPLHEIWVDRRDIRTTRQVRRELPELGEGEVLVRIDKFGLTANNVSYAVAGEAIGYWKFFPAEGEWGKVPVWGFADVLESRQAGIKKGERIWGFFPMASHLVMQPGETGRGQFTDSAAHRRALPALYNNYARTDAEPDFLKALEDWRCVFFPLFMTSFILCDYLSDNGFFGAAQLVIGSASSKTGFGLAHLLHHDAGAKVKVIGLTSPGNMEFVRRLGVYDEILAYGDEAQLDSGCRTAFVDMSGDGPMIGVLHRHFGGNLVESCIVGATHWDQERHGGDLPGARPKFFFAPSQIMKREQDWGPGVAMRKAVEACAGIAASVKDQMNLTRLTGVQASERAWTDLVSNKVRPDQALLAAL